MSITDELRNYAHAFSPTANAKLLEIADRIDKAHKAAVDKAHADGERNGLQQARSASEDWQRGFDAGFASCTDDWLAEHEGEMAEHGWVRLPVDADGVPIHVGDELAGYGYPNGGAYCKAIVGEWGILAGEQECNYQRWLLWSADDVRHHRAPTVEDVLNEMLDVYCSNSRTPCQLVAEYAAKLQLKEVDA